MKILYLFTGYSLSRIMTSTLGLLLLLLPLVAPLIAQNTIKKEILGISDSEECEFYNSSCVTSGCQTKEACNLSGGSQCSVIWTNTSAMGVQIAHKGCIYHDSSCKEVEKCVARDVIKNSSSNNPIYYCCCKGSYCNKEFSWEPPPYINPITPTTNTKVRDAILLTLGGLVFILVITPIAFYYYRKKKMANFLELPTVEASALMRSGMSPCLTKRPIQLLEVKARGRFGAVWKARYCTTDVAVKIFPIQDKESWTLEKRIFSLPHMRHENVLHFIGVEERGEKFSSEFWLITAYHDRGSLYDLLKCNVFTWFEACKIMETMAQGLAYLHSEQPANKAEGLKPSIAHRDFKSKNVLLKADGSACIADFGLAIIFYPGKSTGETHGQVGTRRYMAPEVLEGAIAFHRDAFLPIDMYACGLVLWEIISRCSAQDGPVGEYKLPFEEDVGQHPTLDDMQDCVVTHKNRPRIPNTWYHHPGLVSVVEMMEDSWDHDAEARLSASCIVERVSALSEHHQQAS